VRATGANITVENKDDNGVEEIKPEVTSVSGFTFGGVRILVQGDYFYLSYAHLNVKWDAIGTIFITLDDEVVDHITAIGLCGNFDKDPLSEFLIDIYLLNYKYVFSAAF
jgi:hypothetical protein